MHKSAFSILIDVTAGEISVGGACRADLTGWMSRTLFATGPASSVTVLFPGEREAFTHV